MTLVDTAKTTQANIGGIYEHEDVEYIKPEGRTSTEVHSITLWAGANIEFATIATGVLGTAAFGLSFWQAVWAIVLGNVIGSIALGKLSVYGARFHAPQLVQSRAGFGLYGNNVPAFLNSLSGISWFAVNSVLGAFSMDGLFGISLWLSVIILTLVQVAITVPGHNLIQSIEKWLMGVLAVIFLIACIYGFNNAHYGGGFNSKVAGPMGFSGAFIVMTSIALSYCLGWLAFASDYTRRLPDTASKKRVFLYVSGTMFVTGVVLEALGAALGTLKFIGTPTDLMSGVLPHAVADITLVGVMIGTVTANALNLYSGTISFKVLTIPGLQKVQRGTVVAVSGVLGGIATYFMGRTNFYGHYTEFLFVLGYWVAPWAAIVLVDGALKRITWKNMYDNPRRYDLGLVCWIVAVIVEIFFMNQTMFVGPIAKSHPGLGDITYYVGFAVALLSYGGCRLYQRSKAGYAPAHAAIS